MKDDQKTTEQKASIVELLAMPEAADIDFEPPQLKQGQRKPGDEPTPCYELQRRIIEYLRPLMILHQRKP